MLVSVTPNYRYEVQRDRVMKYDEFDGIKELQVKWKHRQH